MHFLTELTLVLCLISFLSSLFCFYIYIKNKLIYADDKNVIEVIEVVDFLTKLCPLGRINQWNLLPYGHGSPRSWHRLFPIKILNKDVQIHGSSIIIAAYAEFVFEMITNTNTSQWVNWIPTVTEEMNIKLLYKSVLKHDSLLQAAEIVDKCNKTNSYRFCYLDEKNLGWILFWSAQKIEMSFILIQPSQSHESGQCLLTFIFGSCSKFDQRNVAHQLIFNVNSIKEASEIAFLHVLPFCMPNGDSSKTISSVYSSKKVTKGELSKDLSDEIRRANWDVASQNSSQLFILLPHIQPSLPFVKIFKGFELVINNLKLLQDVNGENCDQEIKLKKGVQDKDTISDVNGSRYYLSEWIGKTLNFHRSLSKYNNTSLKRRDNEFCLKRSNTIASAENVDSNIDRSFKSRSASDLLLLKKETLSSITEKPALENELSEDKKYKYSHEQNISLSDNHYNLNEEESNHFSDFEILLPRISISSDHITEIKTKGNYYASKLQAEIHEVTSLLDLKMVGEYQGVSCGGWSFHSIVKGITVLSKQSCSGHLKIISYICDTVIHANLNDVWKVVKNPRSRFICDDSVKKVEILEEIPSDQKIVYVYHESTNILKKESVDFCLLHTERNEQSKYYLSLCSLEFGNCPLMDGLTRGTLLPSGFVVEKCKTEDKDTKVKYLYQVIVSNPNSQFLHELNHSVPCYVLNLKNYFLFKP